MRQMRIPRPPANRQLVSDFVNINKADFLEPLEHPVCHVAGSACLRSGEVDVLGPTHQSTVDWQGPIVALYQGSKLLAFKTTARPQCVECLLDSLGLEVTPASCVDC